MRRDCSIGLPSKPPPPNGILRTNWTLYVQDHTCGSYCHQLCKDSENWCPPLNWTSSLYTKAIKVFVGNQQTMSRKSRHSINNDYLVGQVQHPWLNWIIIIIIILMLSLKLWERDQKSTKFERWDIHERCKPSYIRYWRLLLSVVIQNYWVRRWLLSNDT